MNKRCNKGMTMIEILVAFVMLTLVMVILYSSIKFASNLLREATDVDRKNSYFERAVAEKFKDEDGYKLGSWISNCKMKYNKGKLDEKYIRRFAEYGISLEPKQSRWNEYLEEVREYFILHNTRRIPKGYRGESGIDLNGWISDQRRYYRKGREWPLPFLH